MCACAGMTPFHCPSLNSPSIPISMYDSSRKDILHYKCVDGEGQLRHWEQSSYATTPSKKCLCLMNRFLCCSICVITENPGYRTIDVLLIYWCKKMYSFIVLHNGPSYHCSNKQYRELCSELLKCFTLSTSFFLFENFFVREEIQFLLFLKRYCSFEKA